ncbi:protein-L-isoaspartate(D-aspartate) O-methyltransferase [Actinopolyspora xinjiangensis]|uniref:Protein-L-isoaspartate O-methyltransferase n=1 Tax=Actinopolyspora xinjiangensis TaxID=405564 RepID=A0A1H0VRE1_9ACTN|nr:methyltransferase, FxLD system [Actinopolyspora xinjiangensis]SDP80745.1 protein-L-isoaspartate(D-aspartate) O-methyltransferase [Actinopolyspora xinjiangensis]
MDAERDMAGDGVAEDGARPEALRAAMVEELRQLGAVRSDPVERAFRVVPRHLFSPEEPLMKAYGVNRSVVVKRDDDGMALSTVSAPSMQADMLEQTEVRPGMRVLEIGSGGVNAAMLAELVGSEGHVTTVDIDADVTERARRGLAESGYDQVRVVRADAEHGVADQAPYDRILVTVGVWDIPPAWLDQLAEGGRLIVPLRLRGVMRSIALERAGDRLTSRSVHPCGFVPVQGMGAREEHVALLDEDVALRFDEQQHLDTAGLSEALTTPPEQRWSGITVGSQEMIDDLTLWLTTTLPGCGMLTAKQAAVDRGLVGRPARRGVPAAVDGNSFAYRATVRTTEDERIEFGVYGHGPRGGELAEQHVDLMRQWDRQHRHGPGAVIEVRPAHTPDERVNHGLVLDRNHTRVVIFWP